MLLSLVLASGPAAPASAGQALPAHPWQEALRTTARLLEPLRDQVAAVRSTLGAPGALAAVRASAFAAGRASVLDALPPAAETPRDLKGAVAEITGAVRSGAALVRPHGATGGEHPDSGPALVAAALVARAVDRSLPALRAAAEAAPPGASAATCDVIDESPILCVGGTGPNRYEDDLGVVIDLGGADVYLNNAGAATAFDFTRGPVSVLLDLSGDDLYDAPSRAGVAQGGGTFGGVGLLLDAAGDDRYRMAAPEVGPTGQGFGTLGGAGFLVDAAGNDTYTMDAAATGAGVALRGQGTGASAGVGALVDGDGDDAYLARATSYPKPGLTTDDPPRPQMLYGTANVVAQGAALFGGAGLLADAAGADSFRLEAILAPSPPDAPAVLTAGLSATVGGQGAGWNSPGLLLEGRGRTTYAAVATAGPLPATAGAGASSISQGAALAGGEGVLSDLGGDDAYLTSVTTVASVGFVATDGCACDRSLDAGAGSASAFGQGYAPSGVGLIDDAGGDDRYEADTVSEARLSVRDDRTMTSTPLTGRATAGPAIERVQGTHPEGVAVIWDADGDEAYGADATSRARTEGSATVAANAPVLESKPGPVLLDAQGTGVSADAYSFTSGPGVGSLVDLYGADAYSASGRSDGGPGVAPGTVSLHVQGSVDGFPFGDPAHGHAIDLGGNAGDIYAQTPPSPACQGTRGQGVWVDCEAVGLGVNA